MSLTATALLLSWVAIVLLAFALAGVLARVHRLEQRLGAGALGAPPTDTASGTGPPVGSAAPAVAGVVIDDGVGAILLFADRECGSCLRVLPSAVDAGTAAGVPVHVFWSGPAPVADDAPPGVSHHPDAGAAYVAYRVNASPWLIVVGPDGRITAAGGAGSAARAAAVLAALEPMEEIDR